MRLIPFNVVFLLLLACSLQVGEEYALHRAAGPHAGAASAGRHTSHLPAVSVNHRPCRSAAIDQPARIPGLAPQALSTIRTIWTMRTPAFESTLIASVTGLRRV